MNTLTRILTTSMIVAFGLSISYAQVKFTKKIGGSNGNNFMIPSSRQDVLSTKQITGIAIQHSRRIEQIIIEYANVENSIQAEATGNDAGTWSFIELEEGEFITYITGRAGTLIDQLTIHTSMRRTFGPFGGSGGEEFEINVPSDASVIGFTGRSGPSINQIGLIYKRSGSDTKILKNKYRGTRYQGTEADGFKRSNSPTVRDHRTTTLKKGKVRRPYNKESSFTIRDSILVMKSAPVINKDFQSPITKSKIKEPMAKQAAKPSARKVRDHRNNK